MKQKTENRQRKSMKPKAGCLRRPSRTSKPPATPTQKKDANHNVRNERGDTEKTNHHLPCDPAIHFQAVTPDKRKHA